MKKAGTARHGSSLTIESWTGTGLAGRSERAHKHAGQGSLLLLTTSFGYNVLKFRAVERPATAVCRSGALMVLRACNMSGPTAVE